jgi:ABC-type lipoprotein release transport system permease subunit
MEGITFTEPLIMRLEPGDAIFVCVALILITVAVSAITAWRVTRINPVEALRRSE